MLLYKYRQFDDYSLENLKQSTLWCSEVGAFNDPYELQFELEVRYPGDLDDLYEYWHQRFPDRQIFRRTVRFDAEDIIKHSRTWFGVCCFSELPASTQMWAYYSASHTGFCLGFEFPAEASEDRISQASIHKVEYRNDVKKFPVTKFLSDSKEVAKSLMSLLTIKHTDWQHEREWRFINWKPNQLVGYDPAALKEILVGARASHENVARLRAICDQLPMKVRFRQFVLMHGTYQLRMDDEIEFPDIESRENW
jgi:hypothetical protein